jgi:hypothetical protein
VCGDEFLCPTTIILFVFIFWLILTNSTFHDRDLFSFLNLLFYGSFNAKWRLFTKKGYALVFSWSLFLFVTEISSKYSIGKKLLEGM